MQRIVFPIILYAAAFAAIALPGAAPAQEAAPSNRAFEIAASFYKHKDAVKERDGVRMDKFAIITAVPATPRDETRYAGAYDASFGFTLELRVTGEVVTGRGVDATPTGGRPFILENARIERGILAATKRYTDGSRAPFEGAFLERTERRSRTAPATQSFGIGASIEPVTLDGLTIERLFYKKR